MATEIKDPTWASLSYAEKNKELFERQKRLHKQRKLLFIRFGLHGIVSLCSCLFTIHFSTLSREAQAQKGKICNPSGKKPPFISCEELFLNDRRCAAR